MLRVFISSLFFCMNVFSDAQECSNGNTNAYIQDAGPMVSTESGKIIGKHQTVLDKQVSAFLGIPYAEPPLGNRRFQKPEPIAPWGRMVVAQDLPPPCMQYSSRNYSWIPSQDPAPSEDCLYLNVWVPTSCGQIRPLPVMVWIHGGGYYSGSSNLDLYDGSVLASRGEVIVVSMNYRVGAFGFLYAGYDEAPGNAGLHDQVAALQWVNRNIEYFGGDPKSITLFGESAGAWSISLHLVSAYSRGLFHRAIMQSGTAYSPMVVDEPPVAGYKTNLFAQAAKCVNETVNMQLVPRSVIECLKSKDAVELAHIEDIFTSKVPSLFMPSVDNDFLTQHHIASFASGDFYQIPVIIGVNANESTIFLNYIQPELFPLYEPVTNAHVGKTVIDGIFNVVPGLDTGKIYDFYFKDSKPADVDDMTRRLEQAFGDFTFKCPALFLAEKMKVAFVYWMTHRSDKSPYAKWMGTPHFDEVPYIFGKPMLDKENYTPEDATYSEDLIDVWTKFAKTNYPLLDDSSRPDERNWKNFVSSIPTTLALNPDDSPQIKYPSRDSCEFWRPIFHGAATPSQRTKTTEE